ncbi:hypothetical protein F7725_010739 [Dissostichus mawsoni]|uniref:Uncharacterized protein n=1 Tax=Dissostichus mawsoni TaxID=36200 RepID=A0A7J5ZAZ4_DISMA|nr:hypothetical protein F7725_010739 [Dissostichus mawsoni]
MYEEELPEKLYNVPYDVPYDLPYLSSLTLSSQLQEDGGVSAAQFARSLKPSLGLTSCPAPPL